MNHDICYRCGLPLPFFKELTDEEIYDLIKLVGYPRTFAMDVFLIKSALKKASEK